MELRGNAGNQAEQDDPALPSSPIDSPEYQLGVLFLVDCNDLHALVETAVLAHAVSQLHLMALGALNDAGHGELPVRTTAVLASLRDFSLRKSHGYTSSLLAAKLLTELFFVVGLFSQQLLQCRKRTLYIRIVPAKLVLISLLVLLESAAAFLAQEAHREIEQHMRQGEFG